MAIDIASPRGVARTATATATAAAPRKRSWNIEIRLGAPRVGVQERIVFTERLTLLLETGVSLHEAMKAMHGHSDGSLADSIIAAMADAISEGRSFSSALAQHPEMFPGTYVSLVSAAEEGGFLPQVLKQLLRMDEKNSEMRSNIKSALSYPIFLIAFSILVTVFVLVFIFPKFEVLFASIHDQLPITTRGLMALSAALRHYWPQILVALGAALWALYRWFSSADGRLVMDRARMTVPVIRDIYIKLYLSQTLSVLGLSLTNGVPVTIALRACQGVVANAMFVSFIESVRQHVNEGRGIAIGFSSSALVPPMVQQMVSTAEQTGSLGMVMTRVAEFYERELAKRITVLSKAVEPIMLIVMGVVVGMLVVSLILPIFKLSHAVH
jgi:type II secretory pathway component PulF